MRELLKLTVTTMIVTGGLGLAGFGLASTAQAVVGPVPAYHWCPGDAWQPEWGNNWEGGACHDDFHRDMDGFDRSRDFRQRQTFASQTRDPGGNARHWRLTPALDYAGASG